MGPGLGLQERAQGRRGEVWRKQGQEVAPVVREAGPGVGGGRARVRRKRGLEEAARAWGWGEAGAGEEEGARGAGAGLGRLGTRGGAV